MRLTDLHPTWWGPKGRHGVAIIFDCPCKDCQAGTFLPLRLVCSLNPPIDGGAVVICTSAAIEAAIVSGELEITENARNGISACNCAWDRVGDTFDTLVLKPSIDAHLSGHAHIHIGGPFGNMPGEVVDA